jgi:hypothetical protein
MRGLGEPAVCAGAVRGRDSDVVRTGARAVAVAAACMYGSVDMAWMHGSMHASIAPCMHASVQLWAP